MDKQTFIIDGAKFSSLQEFSQCLSDLCFEGYNWGGNLDVLNDILYGGYGTPESGFILRWENSALSRQRLGYTETIKWLEEHIKTCHPANVPLLSQRLDEAKQGRGETLFDTIVEIIQEGRNGVELRLV
jgi:RNAse (barnase) inhibitor barstar